MRKRYESYKDSGVEWIGKIPAHWAISKLKLLSKLTTGNTPPKKDDDNYEGGIYPWVKPDELNGLNPTNNTKEKLTEKGKSLSRVIPPFSALINCIGDIGKVGYSEQEVSTNQQITSVIFNDAIDKRYGLFHSYIMKDEFNRNSECVVVPILNNQKQGDCFLVIPPLPEQKQIVSYLDKKTSKIDSLIQSKQKKIELLKEKRTALINETVTKGLDPDVEMKDSGVEWIGEIPKHWEINVGSVIGKFSKGKGIPKSEVTESGLPCVRYGEIYTKFDHVISNTKSFISAETAENRVSVFGGTLMLTGSGEKAEEIGKCIAYDGEGEIFVGGDIIILEPSIEYDFRYLTYLINSECIRIQRQVAARGEIIVHIYSKNLRELRYPLPNKREQAQIVSYLDNQLLDIDSLAKVEQNKIKLLKEYRQSLISEVVTGKVRVYDQDLSVLDPKKQMA